MKNTFILTLLFTISLGLTAEEEKTPLTEDEIETAKEYCKTIKNKTKCTPDTYCQWIEESKKKKFCVYNGATEKGFRRSERR